MPKQFSWRRITVTEGMTIRSGGEEAGVAEAAPAIEVVQLAAFVVGTVLLGIAALKDIACRIIPDVVPLGLLAIAIAMHLTDGNTTAALAAGAIVSVLGALCWRLGALGGGDVKPLAACALLVPPSLVPQLVLLTAIAGGVLALLYLVLSCVARTSGRATRPGRPRSLIGRIWRAERWRIRRRAGLPYGCAIAIGTLLTLATR
jgi:prepilin peptidase CpaA